MLTKTQKEELIFLIFSPTAPVDNVDYFVGRQEQVLKIKDAIEERGQHAVMYGGRGVGKTSLANFVCKVFQNLLISKVTCNHSDTFFSIWEKAIERIHLEDSVKAIGFNPVEKVQTMQLQLPEVAELNSSHIERILEVINENVLFIFDEFDCVTDKATKVKMADTLKALSDNVANVTVLIVGIADSVAQLIGEHPSLERCIRQIHLPLMPDDEAEELINNSLQLLDLQIVPEVAQRIIEYASGFPHYIHLLLKFAAKLAVANNDTVVDSLHFDWAVQQSIENSSHSIRTAYEKATSTTKKNSQFVDVIFACAIAETDEDNTFNTNELLAKFNFITQKTVQTEAITYNLGMLCKEERGLILEKVGKTKDSRFKFKNPLMKAFVKLKLHNLKAQ